MFHFSVCNIYLFPYPIGGWGESPSILRRKRSFKFLNVRIVEECVPCPMGVHKYMYIFIYSDVRAQLLLLLKGKCF